MDNNPLIRALAVRTMGCIRVDKITEYLCDPLQSALKVRPFCLFPALGARYWDTYEVAVQLPTGKMQTFMTPSPHYSAIPHNDA